MKCYHCRRTTRWGVTTRSPTTVTLYDTRFFECRWWNDGWTVKTGVTWRSSASMVPAPEPTDAFCVLPSGPGHIVATPPWPTLAGKTGIGLSKSKWYISLPLFTCRHARQGLKKRRLFILTLAILVSVVNISNSKTPFCKDWTETAQILVWTSNC